MASGLETDKGIVDNLAYLPPDLPATILILGPSPNFEGGSSNAKILSGDDCKGAGPNESVPVVGVDRDDAVGDAAAGVSKPETFITHDPDTDATLNGTQTIENVSGEPGMENWTDCGYLAKLSRDMRQAADVLGDSTTPSSAFGTKDDPKIVYIEGDYTVNGSVTGYGVLWVTGKLTFAGTASWYGPIFIVGKGVFEQSGAGKGTLGGASVVANIAGKDGLVGTPDDCAGADGVFPSADDGIGEGTWTVSGHGNGETVYCSKYIDDAYKTLPIKATAFRQW